MESRYEYNTNGSKTSHAALHGVSSAVKHDLETGDVKESNSFLEGNAGYFISGDITDEKLHELLLNYTPYVTFEVHKTVPVTQTIGKLIEINKMRATAMSIPA